MKVINAAYLILLCAALAFGSAYDDNNKGIEALNAGSYVDAINYFYAAYAEQRDNPTIKKNLVAAYNAAALDYDKKGDFDRAYQYMKRAYELDPKSGVTKRNFACLLTNESGRLYQQKNGNDITRLLKESLEYDDSLAETHALLGQAYYDHDDYPLAKKQWEKALKLDPSKVVVRKKLDKLNKELTRDNRLLDTGKYHFKVRYEGVELWTASQEVLDMLEDAYKNAGWKLGISPQEPVTVIIYTQQEFKDITGRQDWFAGVYDGKIRLRKIDVEGDRTRLRQIVYHEYMHAFIHFVAGGNVPAWLHEGIAQCYENMPQKAALDPDEKQLLKSRFEKDIPGLDSIDKMFLSTDSQADVQFAYAYSKAFVIYLIEKGWDSNIRYLLEELRKGSSVDQAFDRVYFRNLEQMRTDWLQYLRSGNTF